MKLDTTSSKYMRLAACALFVSLCGQTAHASDINKAWPSIGAALSLMSIAARVAYPPVSQLGLLLDGTCAATNIYAAYGYKPSTPSTIADYGCLAALGLQYSRLLPALTLGTHDPLLPVRTLLSLANAVIIGYRAIYNYNHPN